jgi:hypothetical protein
MFDDFNKIMYDSFTSNQIILAFELSLSWQDNDSDGEIIAIGGVHPSPPHQMPAYSVRDIAVHD